MRPPLTYLTIFLLLFPTNPAHAFPRAVAGFILGRPITESSVKKQLQGIDDFAGPFVKGTDAITVLQIPVADPEIKLSVLVVEPRRYGVVVKDKIAIDHKTKQVSYTLNLNFDNGPPFDGTKNLLEEFQKEANDEESFDLTPEQVSQLLIKQASIGGDIRSTENPKTVFLLMGYGVPKKAGLPLALLLAKHGIRTVIPDLRGQGKSGGNGVTWGKEEPGDLAGLLTSLQSKGIVTEETVGVMGVSYGAVMASLWAAQDKRIEAVVLAAPYQRADTKIIKMTHSFLGDIKLPFKLKEETLIKGTEIAAERLKSTWEDLSSIKAVTRIQKPILFLASSGDEIIPRKEVEEVYMQGPAGSDLHVFEDLPHLLLGVNFTDLETVVVKWLEKTDFLSP